MKNKSYKGAGVMLFRFNTRYRRFEVLLGKRSVPKGYGKWAIPGGGMENCDIDFSDCAFREFREETGVDIKNLQTQKMAVTGGFLMRLNPESGRFEEVGA